MSILFVNRKAVELCGYTREEMRSLVFPDLLQEPSRAAFVEAVRPSETSAIFSGVRLDATLKGGTVLIGRFHSVLVIARAQPGYRFSRFVM